MTSETPSCICKYVSDWLPNHRLARNVNNRTINLDNIGQVRIALDDVISSMRMNKINLIMCWYSTVSRIARALFMQPLKYSSRWVTTEATQTTRRHKRGKIKLDRRVKSSNIII